MGSRLNEEQIRQAQMAAYGLDWRNGTVVGLWNRALRDGVLTGRELAGLYQTASAIMPVRGDVPSAFEPLTAAWLAPERPSLNVSGDPWDAATSVTPSGASVFTLDVSPDTALPLLWQDQTAFYQQIGLSSGEPPLLVSSDARSELQVLADFAANYAPVSPYQEFAAYFRALDGLGDAADAESVFGAQSDLVTALTRADVSEAEVYAAASVLADASGQSVETILQLLGLKPADGDATDSFVDAVPLGGSEGDESIIAYDDFDVPPTLAMLAQFERSTGNNAVFATLAGEVAGEEEEGQAPVWGLTPSTTGSRAERNERLLATMAAWKSAERDAGREFGRLGRA